MHPKFRRHRFRNAQAQFSIHTARSLTGWDSHVLVERKSGEGIRLVDEPMEKLQLKLPVSLVAAVADVDRREGELEIRIFRQSINHFGAEQKVVLAFMGSRDPPASKFDFLHAGAHLRVRMRDVE